MKASLQHIQVNVSDEAGLKWYKELLKYMGWKVIMEEKEFAGFTNGGVGSDIWVNLVEKKYLKKTFHRKAAGLNHLAFYVATKKGVEKFCEEFVKAKKLPTLYGSPKAMTEYGPKYFAVYFEGPDRVKIEVMYFPK